MNIRSTIILVLLTTTDAVAQDWHQLTSQLTAGLEDRQTLFNDFFNDESPHYVSTHWGLANTEATFIAQGKHLLNHNNDPIWQEQHTQTNQQWNDLVLTGKPINNQWRYFINANLTEPEITLDEAHATLPLFAKTQLKLGQFYSGFGRLNSQHSHDRDFMDSPIIYQRLFGDSSLLEKGIQLSVSPLNNGILGIEQLSTSNTDQFNLPERVHPSLTNTLTRWANQWGPNTYTLMGASMASADMGNIHGQQVATYWKAFDITLKHWLQENQYWQLQGEYLDRNSPAASDLNQNGHYLMVLYRWHPHWRIGVRHEIAHVNNLQTTLTTTHRHTLLLEHDPTSWLRTRVQIGHEQNASGIEGVYWLLGWQASFHWHGAH